MVLKRVTRVPLETIVNVDDDHAIEQAMSGSFYLLVGEPVVITFVAPVVSIDKNSASD